MQLNKVPSFWIIQNTTTSASSRYPDWNVVLHDYMSGCRHSASSTTQIKLFAQTRQPDAPLTARCQWLYEHNECRSRHALRGSETEQRTTMHTSEIYLSTTGTSVFACKPALHHQMECNEITEDVIIETYVERNVCRCKWVSRITALNIHSLAFTQ